MRLFGHVCWCFTRQTTRYVSFVFLRCCGVWSGEQPSVLSSTAPSCIHPRWPSFSGTTDFFFLTPSHGSPSWSSVHVFRRMVTLFVFGLSWSFLVFSHVLYFIRRTGYYGARSPPLFVFAWRLPPHAATRDSRHSLPPPTVPSCRRCSAARAPPPTLLRHPDAQLLAPHVLARQPPAPGPN